MQVFKIKDTLKRVAPAAVVFFDIMAGKGYIEFDDSTVTGQEEPKREIEIGKHGILTRDLYEYRGYKRRIKELEDSELDKQALMARQKFEDIADLKADLVKRLHLAAEAHEKAKKNLDKMDGWCYERLLPARIGQGWLEARKNRRAQDILKAKEVLLTVKAEVVQTDYDLDQSRRDLNKTIKEVRKHI